MPAKRIHIIGLVQGVFFRTHASDLAATLGITGWVSNSPDGSVDIHAEGSPDALVSFERWCARGPDAARVDDIHSQDIPEEGHSTFEILR